MPAGEPPNGDELPEVARRDDEAAQRGQGLEGRQRASAPAESFAMRKGRKAVSSTGMADSSAVRVSVKERFETMVRWPTVMARSEMGLAWCMSGSPFLGPMLS